jgi:hypothetical protein
MSYPAELLSFGHGRYFEEAFYQNNLITPCKFTYEHLIKLFNKLGIEFVAGPFYLTKPSHPEEPTSFYQFQSKYLSCISTKAKLEQSLQEIANTFRNLAYTSILIRRYPERVLNFNPGNSLFDEADDDIPLSQHPLDGQ